MASAPLTLAEELSETGEFIDGIAAIVNEGVVLTSQLESQLDTIRSNAATQGMQLPPEDVLKDQLLERLIMSEIQLQRADRIGLAISDEMLNRSIAGIAEQNGVAFEEMPRLLALDGLDYAEFRRSLRDEITISQLRRIEVGQSINVAEREVEQCIADLEGNVVANSEYLLSHILLSVPESASAAEIAETETLADEIYARAQDGADFRELAVRYSSGPTALEGGSLGWMQGQQVPTLFTDVLQDMGKGDVSQPIRAASSFHIVKVDDLRSAVQRSEVEQARVRHILVQPNELIDDATARQQLEDALERIRAGEEFGEIAKLLSDDPGTANLGGDLGWAGEGVYAPEFEENIAASEIGVVSEPFRTQFGWHILEVLERRVYDNTEDLKRQNCDVRIRNSKAEEESQLWMQRLRDEAFVEKRI
ncbi:MAG: peptidylprolyl isomerase [Gammaproteobacteria bacterium]|nr:peptidylprolyl isomerase [Gammaproteobacteria bacterium]MBT8105581.1 peptidylprolyl isomerase [Gammaproteobacteria bacterium]NNF50296.1 molecular chaperone SurA [Woeseiaceae bacterium]NNK25595.1 molecular chaperone SurA [Woeseiaceae bacterium]NNL64096.1 molecular chaperone SurA [Woeseiaceae bacterium]